MDRWIRLAAGCSSIYPIIHESYHPPRMGCGKDLFFGWLQVKSSATVMNSGRSLLGSPIGRIMGNLVDRIFRQHVVDFLRFEIKRRGDQLNASPLGFPAFNVADSAICVGVTLVFLMTWRNEQTPKPVESASE